MTTSSRVVTPFTNTLVDAELMNQLPRGILGRAVMETSQTGITTADLIDDLEFEFNPQEDGRLIVIEGLLHVQANASNVGYVLEIKKGSTVLQRIKDRFDEANQDQVLAFSFPLEGFTAGTNTISPYIEIDGVATLQVSASSSQKAHLWARDEGPVN